MNGATMYLSQLTIKRFRCLNKIALDFRSGLNVLIGENNSGKTSIIDALRICLSYGSQRRDIYVTEADFHIDVDNPNTPLEDVEFHLRFTIEKEEEAGIFSDLLVVNGNDQELQLHFRYYLDSQESNKRVRYKVWGGANEGQSIAPEVLDLLYFVHLGALRDAVHELRPVRGNRLGELYSNLETDETKRSTMAERVHSSLSSDDDWTQLIKKGRDQVSQHLEQFSFHAGLRPIRVDFLPFEFRRIADSLRVQIELGEQQTHHLELFQNGLGYNNLIYTSVVLGDLEQKKKIAEETYIALLIEEPEAHLHPQLQDRFFEYLGDLDTIGFQVFITSHSPTITAKSDLESLIVLQSPAPDQHAFRIARSALDGTNIRYLQKFLDVTKSQLFFARGVILVEGIAEALLIPVFSRILGESHDTSKNGIEIVNVNGVAFEHFGKLFNAEDPMRRLHRPCVVLTDDDRGDDGAESPRATRAKALEQHYLKVELAERTFEYELFMAGDNDTLLLDVFRELHPRLSTEIEALSSREERAMLLVEKLVSNKTKSEFAHRLAIRLEADANAQNTFEVPQYIRRGLEWVTSNE